MISLSQTRYGSGRSPGGERHGSVRRWRSYQASSATGSGRRGKGEAGGEDSGRVDGMSGGRTDQQGHSLAGGTPQGERRPGMRSAALAAAPVVAPVVAGRGGGVLARLKAEW